jgi:hypothetical protein
METVVTVLLLFKILFSRLESPVRIRLLHRLTLALSRISTPVDIHAVAVFVPNEIILFKKTGLLLVKVIASVSLLIQEPVVEMLPYRITRLASGTFLFSSEKMAFFIPYEERSRSK